MILMCVLGMPGWRRPAGGRWCGGGGGWCCSSSLSSGLHGLFKGGWGSASFLIDDPVDDALDVSLGPPFVVGVAMTLLETSSYLLVASSMALVAASMALASLSWILRMWTGEGPNGLTSSSPAPEITSEIN